MKKYIPSVLGMIGAFVVETQLGLLTFTGIVILIASGMWAVNIDNEK